MGKSGKHQKSNVRLEALCTAELMETVRAIFADYNKVALPERHCAGCGTCCHFRITGETPYVTLPEAFYAWQVWKKTGRTKVALPPDGSCPFLNKMNRCMIHEGRPMACRTHFCVDGGGVIPRKLVAPFITRFEILNEGLRQTEVWRLPEIMSRLAKGK